MKQRGGNLLQLKMFLLLLLIRTSALALLAGLVSRSVATATAGRTLTCRQQIPIELMRDLWSRTIQLIDKLPKEETFSGRRRLLPRFSSSCPELIGWMEIREVIDIYQRSVFSREVVHKLLPLHYTHLLHRLQHTLHRCVSSSKPQKFKLLKKLQKKIKKTRRDDVALKAVREFTFILRRIDGLGQACIL